MTLVDQRAAMDLFGDPPRRPGLDQYFTPTWLAERIAGELGPWLGRRVLEPSAGQGALALPIARAGAAKVLAVELDPGHAEVLRARAWNEGLTNLEVVVGDFLSSSFTPDDTLDRFDVVVTNPPYGNELDSRFVARALWSAPRVVAVVRSAFLHTAVRYRRVWTHARIEQHVVLVDRPDFGGDESAKYDYAVLALERLRSPRRTDECDFPRVRFWRRS